MTVSINGTSGLVFNDASTQATAATGFGFKNRIINGAMVIDQRNAGASGTASVYTVDRWGYYGSQASKGTWQQNAGAVTPPSGFINYLGFTSSSAYSVSATDQFYLYQRIEGLNTSDLGFGSASASAVTFSFWVRSSLTGTFGGVLTNSAANRTYPFSYTISAANTWEQKSVTIAGDTTGTWLTTSGTGIGVLFNLGTGSTYSATANAWTATSFVTAPTGATSVVGTNGATFYITGVQLEKGSTATSFDYRPYGTELILAQRYAFKRLADGSVNNFAPFGMGRYFGTTSVQLYVPFPVTMRTSPSSITVGGTLFVNDAGFGGATFTSPVLNESSCDGATITGGTTSSGTAGYATTFYANDTSVASILFFAEL
jgi:hypothetical protein